MFISANFETKNLAKFPQFWPLFDQIICLKIGRDGNYNMQIGYCDQHLFYQIFFLMKEFF